jgi:spore coat protein U-like protein
MRFLLPVAAALLLSLECAPVHAANSCSVSATSVSFGNYNPAATSPTTSTGTIGVNCLISTSDTITVALSTGLSGSYTARTMLSGTNTLTYNLYLNSARTEIWGNGTGGTSEFSDTIAGGTGGGGGGFATTVFGEIPAQQNPFPGSYSDTITVTVNF